VDQAGSAGHQGRTETGRQTNAGEPIKKRGTAPRPVDAARAARAKAQRQTCSLSKMRWRTCRDQTVTTGVNTKTRRSGSYGTAASAERSLITSDLTRAAGGINTASLSATPRRRLAVAKPRG